VARLAEVLRAATAGPEARRAWENDLWRPGAGAVRSVSRIADASLAFAAVDLRLAPGVDGTAGGEHALTTCRVGALGGRGPPALEFRAGAAKSIISDPSLAWLASTRVTYLPEKRQALEQCAAYLTGLVDRHPNDTREKFERNRG